MVISHGAAVQSFVQVPASETKAVSYSKDVAISQGSEGDSNEVIV